MDDCVAFGFHINTCLSKRDFVTRLTYVRGRKSYKREILFRQSCGRPPRRVGLSTTDQLAPATCPKVPVWSRSRRRSNDLSVPALRQLGEDGWHRPG